MIQAINQAETPQDVLGAGIFQKTEDCKTVRFNIEADDFYKKKYAKYLLLRLDMALNENANVKKSYTGIISVEHILPQKPPKGSSWEHGFTEEERKIWTHRLGNLVLLSRKKNSSANNRDFDIKLKKYFSNGITDFELTKELKNFKGWTIKECEFRQEDLVRKLMGIYFS
ncbi:HNH endonuclease family protein [Bacillus songklensis]|uniref:HNH endonuclease family protein n=1 Tax=Bacillus songklensis TaxID=1069116 RepID=A0ABV8B869_9BACI